MDLLSKGSTSRYSYLNTSNGMDLIRLAATNKSFKT